MFCTFHTTVLLYRTFSRQKFKHILPLHFYADVESIFMFYSLSSKVGYTKLKTTVFFFFRQEDIGTEVSFEKYEIVVYI